MKKLIITIIAAAFITSGCLNRQPKTAIDTLKEFYTLLFTEIDREHPDTKSIEAIMNRYVTAQYQEELGHSDLDYHYFSHGQEYGKARPETLEITPDDSWDVAYNVCWRTENSEKVCLKLTVEKTGKGQYMINGISAHWVEVEDDDVDDEYDGDFSSGHHLSAKFDSINAHLMALTDCEGMSEEYSRIRQVMLFASNMFAFMPFPFIDSEKWMWVTLKEYEWVEDQDKFESFDEYIAENDYGYGETFAHYVKYLYHIRESDLSSLPRLLQRYGKLVKLIFPRERYVANGWDAMVRQLLVAYDDLSAQPGNFQRIYKAMTTDNEGKMNSPEYFEDILPFVRDRKLSAFVYENNNNVLIEKGEVNQWAVVWAYSFWGRRFHDNPENIQHLVSSLKLLRDELYATGHSPKMDKNIPPIEPYLTSDIRPDEKIFPWKFYIDRVKFVKYEGEEDGYDYIVVEKNGSQHRLFSNLDNDEVDFNRGDVIDIRWNMEISTYYDEESDIERMIFSEWAQSIRMVEKKR